MTAPTNPLDTLRPHMPVVAPSLLSANFLELGHEVSSLEKLGARIFHVDVMDGAFVPNITFGPPVVKALRKATDLPLDVHLMVDRPERYLEAFADAGADILTVHPEACVHLHRTLQRIEELGMARGVALNPSSPLSLVEEVISDIDLLLIMTVNPGFGGQAFIPSGLSKLRRASELISAHESHAVLAVDGGVSPTNARALTQAGTDLLVSGSALLTAPDRAAAMEAFNRESTEGKLARTKR